MVKAPFVPGANVAELTAEYEFGTKQMDNVYHFHSATPWTVATLTTLCNNFIGWETSQGRLMRSHQVGLITVKARDLTTQTGLVAESSDTLPLNGSVNVDSQPNNVTMVLSLRTGHAGRSYRGRSYFIGLCVGHVVNNQVVASIVPQIVAAQIALITAANSWGTPLGVFSRRQGGVWLVAGGVFTPATLYKSDGNVHTQRRRLPGA